MSLSDSFYLFAIKSFYCFYFQIAKEMKNTFTYILGIVFSTYKKSRKCMGEKSSPDHTYKTITSLWYSFIKSELTDTTYSDLRRFGICLYRNKLHIHIDLGARMSCNHYLFAWMYKTFKDTLSTWPILVLSI